jgi:hypothetical protein
MQRCTLLLICLTAAGCSGFPRIDDRSLTAREVSFTDTPPPLTMEAMSSAYTRSSATVTFSNGQQRTYPLRYQTLYRSGESIGGWRAGAIVDRSGQPIAAVTVGENVAPGPFYAKAPDANSLIQHDGALHLVTHFEYDTEVADPDKNKPPLALYGRLPMTMNLATLDQKRDGRLSVERLRNIDMSAVHGLWTPCGGELSPWNTHLGGEEYEPDAQTFETQPLAPMNRYLGTLDQLATAGGANPYHYGYLTEVAVNAKGATTVTKHYALGRLAHELAHVLPDRRTAYQGDDGRDGILTLFVADREDDLSRGTLYAAKFEQQAAEGGGHFGVRWIRLGQASNAEIGALIGRGLKFSDIFALATADDVEMDPAAHTDYRPVRVYPGFGGKARVEYLQLKPGMEQAAAFLETRRYAALLGATTELTKLEGVTSNSGERRLYVALSAIEAGMLDGHNDARPQDDIRLTDDPKDLQCGGVYELTLTENQTDTSGAPIASRYVANEMRALLLGARKPATQTAYGKYDQCDTDRVSGPDNIKYSAVLRTLFIGEDSAYHLNNFLWAYQLDTRKLTRLASAPAGAEWTGLQVVENVHGIAYLFANVQHPGATYELAGYPSEIKDPVKGLRAQIDQRGAVGYLFGLPAIRRAP